CLDNTLKLCDNGTVVDTSFVRSLVSYNVCMLEDWMNSTPLDNIKQFACNILRGTKALFNGVFFIGPGLYNLLTSATSTTPSPEATTMGVTVPDDATTAPSAEIPTQGATIPGDTTASPLAEFTSQGTTNLVDATTVPSAEITTQGATTPLNATAAPSAETTSQASTTLTVETTPSVSEGTYQGAGTSAVLTTAPSAEITTQAPATSADTATVTTAIATTAASPTTMTTSSQGSCVEASIPNVFGLSETEMKSERNASFQKYVTIEEG
ncbi:hypothetical protein V5799_016959, partial [Amblyomma americanum]